MSGTTWTGTNSNDWFDPGNWTNGVPVVSNTGNQTVTVSGTVGTQPVIAASTNFPPPNIFVVQGGQSYQDVQIDGQFIKLTNTGIITLQGVAIGTYNNTADGTNITNLTAAGSSTPTYDKNMVVSATGAEKLITQYVNHNFGLIESTGTGNSLNITIQTGGAQTVNGLFNYGEILAGPGASVNVAIATPGNGSTNTFGNAGYIVASGGTFTTSATISDGANVKNGGTTPDGYIEIGNGGVANLLGSVTAKQEVLFTDTLNNILQIANNNSFSGNIAGFSNGDTISIAGVTSGTTLGYSGSILTVGELNSSGAVTQTVSINVGTGYSVGSFGALLSTSGVNIETPATEIQQPYTFTGTTGQVTSFEDPSQYLGKVAPGTNILAGETVVIASNTANIGATTLVTNNGTILVSGSTSALIDSSSLSGTGTLGLANGGKITLANATGTDSGQTVNFGTGATSLAPNVLDITGSTLGFGGTIAGFASNDHIVLGSAALPAAAAGSSFVDSFNSTTGVLTVKEISATGATIGTSTLTFAPGSTFNSGSFVDVSGPGGVTVELGSTPLSNGGSIFIDYGEQVTLTNTTGVDTIPVTFGTHGSISGLNVLDINGTVSGTSAPYGGTISGFGLNDDIVLGTSVLPSVATGSQVSLSVTGNVLSVTEISATGTTLGTTTLNVGPGYTSGSFVALLGTNGINIETPATAAEGTYIFNATGTASFEDPTKYTNSVAPGSSIVSGEIVTIASGTASIASSSPVTNSGTILVSGSSSSLYDSSALSGTGTLSLASGGHATLANTTGTDSNFINFGTGGTATNPNLLDLTGTGTTSFGGTIQNFGTFDTIIVGASVLPGTETSFSTVVSGGHEVLTVTSSVSGVLHTDSFTFSAPPPGVFSVSNSGAGIVIADIPCFAAGTRILTPQGLVPVETLAEGSDVVTQRDGSTQKIIWAGQRTVDLARHANPEKVRPVRILADAFGPNLPVRDLRLSPDHALYINGHLVEAKTLVNGVTIIQEQATGSVTYHHIELARHDVVLAEGLQAETYLDSANRSMFQEGATALTLHADFAAQSRALACAPLVVNGDVVLAIRQQLLERAQQLGHQMTDALDLTARCGSQTIMPDISDDGLTFLLPAGANEVELLSAYGVPAEISAHPGDRRTLGVAITSLALIAGGVRTLIALDDAAHSGFFAMEATHRWTNGHACIKLPAYSGRAVLEMTINGQAARWMRAA